MKNAFERTVFWWPLSLTTLFSNTFHTAFHARKGFLSSELPVRREEGDGDGFLWTQVGKEPPVNGNGKVGGESKRHLCLLLQTRPTAMWSVLFPFCLCQDYSRQQKSLLYKAWPEHSPKWPRLFSWSTVHLSVKRIFLLTYLLLHYFHRLSLFQSWFLWVLVIDKKICSHREGGICVTFSLIRGKVEQDSLVWTHTKRTCLNTFSDYE